MQIWVDGDACPAEVKELLFKTAERRQVRVVLVANQPMRVPKSEFVSAVCVPGGMNMADRHIAEQVASDDLVVTADIPLAAAVVDKGATALGPRGDLYTETNMGERLAARNLLDELRGGGLVTGGPAPYSAKDRQAFANQLDRWLTRTK